MSGRSSFEVAKQFAYGYFAETSFKAQSKCMPKAPQKILKDQDIVLVIGAGVHHAARYSNPRAAFLAQQLANWSGLQYGAFGGDKLSQTLSWELNALTNHQNGQGHSRLVRQQKQLAEVIGRLAEIAHSASWQPPLALEELLLSGVVKHVISLNVDLVLERWLANRLKIDFPEAHPESKGAKQKKNEQNQNRHRRFKSKRSSKVDITFWYPHGDLAAPESLQFALSDYAKTLAWMEPSRAQFKIREKSLAETKQNPELQTWLDPFLCRKDIMLLGTSLDPAEWDLWFALLCRWRNFAQREMSDWYPTTHILTCKGLHTHLPQGYIERIEGSTFEEAWENISLFYKDKIKNHERVGS